MKITDLQTAQTLVNRWFNIRAREQLLHDLLQTASDTGTDIRVTLFIQLPDKSPQETMTHIAATKLDDARAYFEGLFKYERFECETDMYRIGLDVNDLRDQK